MKDYLGIFAWYVVTIAYIVSTIVLDTGEYITYHLNKNEYIEQQVVITHGEFSTNHRWGYFTYNFNGEIIEGDTQLNFWESTGDEVVIEVNDQGEYLRPRIIVSERIIASIILLIFDIVCLVAMLDLCIKKLLGRG